jgi:hypothetical protein
MARSPLFCLDARDDGNSRANDAKQRFDMEGQNISVLRDRQELREYVQPGC